MSHSKFNCSRYPEDAECTIIKGQLDIEGDILTTAICCYVKHNQPSHCTTLTYYSLCQLPRKPKIR